MQTTVKPRQVACPGCSELVVYSTANPYRPFCSERCKLMDLGDWATEKFRIPDATPPDLDESES
ncbi:DNA gyrase inhibitor YacG [Methylophilus flavus]|jgi:uncharacterized protein|uniref:DNA gyrase inhibitor YacG n=1 Tax=Methylophilus flavus TaxID=640084 RepID=A0ABW3PB01_9PROT